MIEAPNPGNPWAFPLPGSVPAGIGGFFNAWGWVRDLFNSAIPSAVSDLTIYNGIWP